MSCCNRKDFCLSTGETFRPIFRWALETIDSKAITAITRAAPVVVTAVAHGLPEGWPCAVVGAQGMSQINAERYPPRVNDWHKGTPLTADTVQLNSVSSTDYTAYTSGGFLVYHRPAELAGVTATFKVWATPEHTGTPLVSLTELAGITVDNSTKTIIPMFQTEGETWTTGYYELAVTDPNDVVTTLVEGVITLE